MCSGLEELTSSLSRNPLATRGLGKTVEVDELSFSRRKFEVTCVGLHPQQWVFGGICSECFLYTVWNRTVETLLDTNRACIRFDTTTISNVWRAYDGIVNLPGINILHLTVNHSQNFVDPVSGAHTQTIEMCIRDRPTCCRWRRLDKSRAKWNQGNGVVLVVRFVSTEYQLNYDIVIFLVAFVCCHYW